MEGLQGLIHKLEEGEWARPVKLVTALLVLLALTVWYDLHQFRNFYAAEPMDAAQAARNLSEGKGFTTQCIRPLSLFLVEQAQGVNARLSRQPELAHPDLMNPPVYPLMLAGLMKVVPFNYEMVGKTFWRYQPEMVIAVFNQMLFFLTVWLVFALARRLFDLPVAILTAILLLGSDLLWRFSVSGQSTLLLLLIFTGLVWALVLLEQGAREGQRGTGWLAGWALAVGALVGLGGLTRYAFLLLIVPVLGYCAAYLGARRGLVCALVAGAFLLVAAPWLTRNYRVSGTLCGVPTFALQQETPAFPETRLERTLKPDFTKVAVEDYARKLLVNMAEIVQTDLPKLGGSWVSAFFLVGLLLPFRNPALGRLRVFLLSSVVVLAVTQALGHTHLSTDSPVINSENLLVLLAPMVFLFGVGFFQLLLDQVNLPFLELRQWITGAFLVVGCGPLILTLLPPRSYPIVYPPYLPPWIQESAGFLRKNELMMSDMPWAVAWYGNRACVWTTLDTHKSFYAINDEQKAISALYLTPLTTDAKFLTQVLRGPDWDWGRFAVDVLMRTNLPPGFPLRDARSGYVPDQLFLCDRPRWRESAR